MRALIDMSKFFKKLLCSRVSALLITPFFLTACTSVHIPKPDQGRLIGTAGMSQIEGSAGSGISNWATITGYGTSDSYGATAFHSHVALDDFSMRSTGAAIGVKNRLELSYARQSFDMGDIGPTVGLGLSLIHI